MPGPTTLTAKQGKPAAVDGADFIGHPGEEAKLEMTSTGFSTAFSFAPGENERYTFERFDFGSREQEVATAITTKQPIQVIRRVFMPEFFKKSRGKASQT